MLDNPNVDEDDREIARIALERQGVAADATEAQIRSTLSRDDEIAAAKTDRDLVAGSSQDLRDAAARLDALDLAGSANDQTLATKLVSPQTAKPFQMDRDLIRDSQVVPADALARLQNAGLSSASTDGALALTLINAATLELRKTDRDILAQYDANKSVELAYADSVLDVRFSLAKAVVGDYDLDFDLADLPGVGDLLTGGDLALSLTSDGKVHVDADIDFDLNFTFDVSQIGSPKFVIYRRQPDHLQQAADPIPRADRCERSLPCRW